jgi:putative transcriptional regulator
MVNVARGGTMMAVSYTKLWKLLLDKKLKRIHLKELAGISSSTLAKLGKDEYVSMGSLERICGALHCNIGDVVEFT